MLDSPLYFVRSRDQCSGFGLSVPVSRHPDPPGSPCTCPSDPPAPPRHRMHLVFFYFFSVPEVTQLLVAVELAMSCLVDFADEMLLNTLSW